MPLVKGGELLGAAGPLIRITRDGSVSTPDDARRSGKIWVAADISTPFSTFAEILPAIGEDGGTAVVLVFSVDGIRGFEMRPALVDNARAPANSLNLRVAVLEDGYRVAVGGPEQPGQPVDIALAKPGTPLAELERWDVEALRAKVVELKRLFPNETSVWLCAEATVPLRALVVTAETLRGRECTAGTAPGCRFSNLRTCTEPSGTTAPAVAKEPSAP